LQDGCFKFVHYRRFCGGCRACFSTTGGTTMTTTSNASRLLLKMQMLKRQGRLKLNKKAQQVLDRRVAGHVPAQQGEQPKDGEPVLQGLKRGP